MNFLYKKLSFLLLAALPAALQAQNLPQLSETAPAGSSTAVPAPPGLSGTAVPSFIRVYSPKVPMVAEPYLNTVVPDEVQVATDYKDGFNRTMMSVAHSATMSDGTTYHLVQPVDTRFTREQLGFPAYASGTAEYTADMFSKQSDYYALRYPDENYSAVSKAQVLSTASVRGVKTLAPGKSQIGQNRGITTIKTTNAATEVRIWELNGSDKPVSYGHYAAGQLFGEKNYDTSGGETLTYSDKDGRIVSKSVKVETVVSGTTVLPVWATTVYVYDDYGRLCYTLPPLAYAAAPSGTLNQDLVDSLCFQYQYDGKGRLTGQRKPGEWGFTELVYDKRNRLVMRRTPNEAGAATPQWEVTFYDLQGRVKATALYNNSQSRSYWQGVLDGSTPGSSAADLSWHLMTAAGQAAYPAENAISGNTMMSYTYYDDYSHADAGDAKWLACGSQLSFTELLNTPAAETPVRSYRTEGMATGGKVRILPGPGISTAETGQWTETAVFYDDKGRVIYSVAYDMDGSTAVHAHYTGTQYDFMGRPLISKHKMFNGSNPHTELSRNYYSSVTGQLMKTTHKNDNQAWTISSLYYYDALGRVQRKVLGNYGEVQDLSYNIRGQLTGINETYALTGSKQGQSRSFGEALRYDYGFSQPRYDGKVSGMIWRGSTTADMFAYGYSYDYGGRLKSADYRKWEPAGGTYFTPAWRNDLRDYTVSNLAYDINGNIKNMDQKGPGTTTPTTIDQLSYQYKGNRLVRVTDGITTDYGNGDFQNGVNTGDDYDYDANGNLTKDGNKNLVSVTYNHLNKPVTLTMSNGKTIVNSYDATGAKVREDITDATNGNKTTTYIGNYVYEGTNLKYLLTPKGRNVYDKDQDLFKEEYFVKDHLGNIRSVVDVHNYPVMQYLATYEVASANLENFFFDNVDEVRDDRPGATWNGDLKSARLGPDTRTGTSLLLKVMAGDKVGMNVSNFYDSYDEQDDSPVSGDDMLADLVSVLAGGSGGLGSSESHDTKRINDMFGQLTGAELDDILQLPGADPSRPKAFLNYVLFDEGMHVVPEGSGSFQANGNGTWTQIGTTSPLVIPANGYLAVYLNNRSQLSCGTCSDVFFDQLTVTFSKGELQEESHYYPHGLPMAGIGGAANDFMPNRRRYQGNEYIKDIGLNWMDFHNRQYDPQIGRFLQVDPLAAATDRMSPYTAMNNDPVLNVDPLGLMAYISKNMINDLNRLFGKGNFSVGEDGKFTFINQKAALETFVAVVTTEGIGGTGGMSQSLFDAALSILAHVGDGAVNSYSGYAGNSVVTSFSTTLPEVTVSSNQGYLNVVQAARLNIGRNDYNRQRADWASNMVMGQMAIGAAPFVGIAAAEVAPLALTSFLSNPAGWTSTAAGVGYGAAGYEGEVPGLAGLCFAAGTKVKTAQGDVNIEDIKAGDVVWSFNVGSGKNELKSVEKLFVTEHVKELYKLAVGKEVIVTTAEHPFYVNGKWIAAKDLKDGDAVQTISDNGKRVVTGKQKVDTSVTVYNFEVKDNHNYYVSRLGVLVHNTCSRSALTPLGRGSTGRTQAVNLVEQMAMEDVMANPQLGEVLKNMKPLSDPRWHGWLKMQYSIKTQNGLNAVIHYVGEWEDGVLKAVDDFKFK